MRDDAYEGVPGVFDLVRAKARGLTEEQAYREQDRKVREKAASEHSDATKSLQEERKAIRDYAARGAAAKSPALKQEYKRIKADEQEHADSFAKQTKRASFMDGVKKLFKEPTFIAALAAPTVGFGVNELSKHRTALRQAKAKAENYRTMMDLHPRLRIHDQKEIGRIYNTLHNVNPTMGNDPLIAGAWIDNIMEMKVPGHEGGSNQALLAAVKDLAGVRSSLSQAMRNEQGVSQPGGKIESFIAGVGKDVDRAIHDGLDAKKNEVKKLWDDRERGFQQLVINEGQKIREQREQVQAYAQEVHARDKKATEEGLSLFFKAAGLA